MGWGKNTYVMDTTWPVHYSLPSRSPVFQRACLPPTLRAAITGGRVARLSTSSAVIFPGNEEVEAEVFPSSSSPKRYLLRHDLSPLTSRFGSSDIMVCYSYITLVTLGFTWNWVRVRKNNSCKLWIITRKEEREKIIDIVILQIFDLSYI